mgnify:CR=1 FL=1
MCLQHLRAALCTTRIDYASLTDHDDTMADEEFAAIFSKTLHATWVVGWYGSLSENLPDGIEQGADLRTRFGGR